VFKDWNISQNFKIDTIKIKILAILQIKIMCIFAKNLNKISKLLTIIKAKISHQIPCISYFAGFA